MRLVYTILIAILLLPLAYAADLNITSTAITTATVGTQYTYQLTASQPNVTYSLLNGPGGMTLSSSGLVNFLPSSTGSHSVILKANNGTNEVTQSYTLIISQNSALSFTTSLIGGPKQKRSNPSANDEARKNLYTDARFILKNTGTEKIRNITFSSTAIAKYNVTFLNVPDSLDPNTEVTITMKARVPEDLSGYFPDRSEQSEPIGEIIATGKINNVTITTIQPAKIQAENLLVIRDVHINTNGKSVRVNENDRVNDLRARDQLELEVDVENLFSTNDNEDLDIQDVNIDIDTTTKEFDIDTKIELGDIRSNTVETGNMVFYVEDDASDGTYKVTLTAVGKDENGAEYGDTIYFALEIVKKQYEISVEKMTMNPVKLTCATKQATLAIQIRNTGKTNEERGAIEVTNKEANFAQKISPIKLTKDDVIDEKFIIPLKPGKNNFQIYTYYDYDKVSNSDIFIADVPDCTKIMDIGKDAKLTETKPTENEETSANTPTEATNEQEEETQEIAPIIVPETKEEAKWPYVLLGMAVIAALSVVGVLFWIVLKE